MGVSSRLVLFAASVPLLPPDIASGGTRGPDLGDMCRGRMKFDEEYYSTNE